MAIVAIEPMGPPFADILNIGKLTWGLTASPLRYEPQPASPDEPEKAEPVAFKLRSLTSISIAAVIGETSAFAAAGPPIVAMLAAAGATAQLIRLTDHGIFGNGQRLIYEKNSDQALQPVLQWLADVEQVSDPKSRAAAMARAPKMWCSPSTGARTSLQTSTPMSRCSMCFAMTSNSPERCTPGQIMSAAACIAEGPTRSDHEIREWMSGNLRRRGAYGNILAAVRHVAGGDSR